MKKMLVVLIIWVLVPLSAFAVKVNSLYQAEIPVAAQVDDLKEQAIRSGFLQMLIKVSGDPLIDKNPVIKPELQKADYYVQELSYSAPTTTSSLYMLKIRYEREDVNRLLKKAGVSWWGETRPLILVWLALTNNRHTTEIIANEMPGELFHGMKIQGDKFGLPLIFPIMDVTDLTQISPNDITSVSIPALRTAGKRYVPDAILVGNMHQTATGYSSEWQLILGNEQWKWTLEDKNAEAIIATLMNQISQTLSKHYVVKDINVSQQWVKLEVMNVTQHSDLTELMHYLKQLSPVMQVQLSQISSDVVELAVLVRGSINAFVNNATIGQRLVLKFQDREENKLVYVWIH